MGRGEEVSTIVEFHDRRELLEPLCIFKGHIVAVSVAAIGVIRDRPSVVTG
jgi:hypothetical protein